MVCMFLQAFGQNLFLQGVCQLRKAYQVSKHVLQSVVSCVSCECEGICM